MSMLSDPKQKQHYVLQPKGKPLWSDDSTSFGAKMLEKMGWTKGKGLGKNLGGSQDFIKVTYKHDIKGLGFNDKSDQWTDHEKQFSCLLNSLNNSDKESNLFLNKKGECNDLKKNKSKSLEENSKNSKVRVHYKKFTKAKDISQYSEKDLATIFGKKSLEVSTTIGNNVKFEENIENSVNGLTIINSNTNVHEYFKRKMSEIQNLKKNKSDDNGDKNHKSKKRHYTENNDTNSEFISEMINCTSENQNIRKKKKKNEESNKYSEISEIKADMVVEVDENSLLKKSKMKHKEIHDNYLEETKDQIKHHFVKNSANSHKLDTKSIEQLPTSKNLKFSGKNVCEENEIKKKSKKRKAKDKSPVEIVNVESNINEHNTKQKKKIKNINVDLQLEDKESYDNYLKKIEGKPDCLFKNKSDCLIICETKSMAILKNPADEQQEYNNSENLKISENSLFEENGIKIKSKRRKANEKSSEEIIKLESNVIVDKTKEKQLLKRIETHLTSKKERNNCLGALEINQKNVAECEKKTKKNKTKNKIKDENHHNSLKINLDKKENLILNQMEESPISENIKPVVVKKHNEKIEDQKDNYFQESMRNKEEYINKSKKMLINESEINNIQNKFYEIKNNRKKIMSVKIENSDSTVENKLRCDENNRFSHIESDSYEITKYCAEKFRLTDLDGFNGANLKKISGYGLRENFEINVVETFQCTELITKFWNIKMFNSTVNSKYKSERSRENEYQLKVNQARTMKAKIPKRNVKYLKKKSAFNQVLV